MSAAIQTTGLGKRYGSVWALQDVTLAVPPGRISALVGANGAGKTTLLRMLAGVATPSSGTITVGGQHPADDVSFLRRISYVAQDIPLYGGWTVADQLKLGTELNEDFDDVGAEERMRALGIPMDRKISALSGGMRAQVALALALGKQPAVLLLDEPLAALDKKLREATQFELINIQEQLGVTFIVVTHDQEESMTLASRIGVMNRGEIVQIGTPTEIYEFPMTKFVADFIGSVNMFEGQLVEDLPDRARIKCDELDNVIYIDHGISSAPSATVWVAVRPEKINLQRTPPADTQENCVKGVVKEIAYMGDLSIYLVKIDSGKTVRVTLPNIERLSDDERILWDETVWLSWHASSPVVVTQ